MLRYYLITIAVATACIAGVNAAFANALGFTPLYVVLATVLFVLFAFTFDALLACLCRVLPKGIFNPFRKRFTVSDKEKRRYDKLKIKSWKDKIPEVGALLKIFDKTKIENPDDPKYIFAFLRETCYAEIMHEYAAVLAFWLLFLAPGLLAWTVALPVLAVNFTLQLFPVATQRYNRHRLSKLYLFRTRHQKRSEPAA